MSHGLIGWGPARGVVVRVAEALRHAPDRLLHRRRHRLAWRRLERLPPRSVLIVCRGNLCRSPYAAQRLRAALGLMSRNHLTVDSAGFLAPGHRPPRNALAAAQQLGIDLSSHQSRPLHPDLIRQADLVLAMEPEQQRSICVVHHRTAATTMLLGDFDPEPVTTRAIADPYGRQVGEFVECYRRIDRCIEVVARGLAKVPHRTQPAPVAMARRVAAPTMALSRRWLPHASNE